MVSSNFNLTSHFPGKYTTIKSWCEDLLTKPTTSYESGKHQICCNKCDILDFYLKRNCKVCQENENRKKELNGGHIVMTKEAIKEKERLEKEANKKRKEYEKERRLKKKANKEKERLEEEENIKRRENEREKLQQKKKEYERNQQEKERLKIVHARIREEKQLIQKEYERFKEEEKKKKEELNRENIKKELEISVNQRIKHGMCDTLLDYQICGGECGYDHINYKNELSKEESVFSNDSQTKSIIAPVRCFYCFSKTKFTSFFSWERCECESAFYHECSKNEKDCCYDCFLYPDSSNY